MSTLKQPITGHTLGEVCIPNISPAERRKRLNLGIKAAVVSVALLVFLMTIGAHPLLRLVLIAPIFLAATCYFQWHDKTCVGLAMTNSRKIGDRVEKIEDASELAQVLRQARRVQMKAAVVAIPLTLVALLLPSLV